MSQHPHAPGPEPRPGFTSDDRLHGTDQFHEIPTHRARRRSGRRRAFLIACGLAVLVGSGVAYGAQHQHAPTTATGQSQPTGSTSAAQQQPGAVPSASHVPASSAPAPPSPSAAKTPTAGAAPKAAPSATHGKTAGERIITAYLTGYSYFDNTPPGSVEISNPVLHTSAGGTGTYADPITLAVGHSLTGGRDVLDWPAGTRFYVPNLRKYFVAEDTCGDGSHPQDGPCHVGYPSSASTWLDLWIGGKGGSTSGSNACMDAITGVWSVIVAPPSGLATIAGSVYGPSGCAKQYGNTVTTG